MATRRRPPRAVRLIGALGSPGRMVVGIGASAAAPAGALAVVRTAGDLGVYPGTVVAGAAAAGRPLVL